MKISKISIVVLLLAHSLNAQTSLKQLSYQDSLKLLKIVVIVGGDDMQGTITENATFIINDLKQRGLKVFKNTDAHYTSKSCKDANIIIYIGHGSIINDSSTSGYWNLNGSDVTDNYIKQFKLKENSLVIYHMVCSGAGSSSRDNYDIGFDEAKRRIKIHGDLYLKNKSKCYFATNTSGGLTDFFNLFFNEKMTIDNIFNKQIIDYQHPSYNIKNYTINNMFKIKVIRRSVQFLQIKNTYDYTYYANPTYNIKNLLNN